MIRNFSGQLMLQSRKIAKARLKRAEMAELRRRYALLTPREREVLPFVVAASSTKADRGRTLQQ
jgi:FixJ family two-component response regulator